MAARLTDAVATARGRRRGRRCPRAARRWRRSCSCWLLVAALAQMHRALSVRSDARPRSLLAAQPALPRRHRRIRPGRVQPAADRLAAVAGAGRHRDADQHGRSACRSGLLAGYRRGLPDEVVMRALDVMMAFPPIMLVLLILAVTPPSLMKTAIAIGVLSVPPIAPRHAQRHARSDERRVHRGRTRPRRAPVLHAAARAAAECLAGADGRGQPARGVRRAAGRGAELSRLRRAAAGRRLGPDDQQRPRLRRHRAVDLAGARASR